MSLQSKEPSVNFAKLIAADPDNVRHFDAISEEFCLQAVRIKGSAIQYIKNPSELVQLEAVKQDPRAIQYIKNPSAQIQLEACSRDNFAIQYIGNPSESVLNYVKPRKSFSQWTEEGYCFDMSNPQNIQIIKNK